MNEPGERIVTGTFLEQRVDVGVGIDVDDARAKRGAQEPPCARRREAADEQLVPDARALAERRDEGAERLGSEGRPCESAAGPGGQSREQILPPCRTHRRVPSEELVAAVARQRDGHVRARRARQEIERDEAHVGDGLVEKKADTLHHIACVGRRDDQLLVDRAEAACREACMATLVVRGLDVTHRERRQSGLEAHGRGGDRRRVDAAAQEAPDGNVGHETRSHRFVDGGADGGVPVFLAHPGLRRERNRPVPFDAEFAVPGDREHVRRRQLVDAADDRVRVGHVIVGEVAQDALRTGRGVHGGVRQHRAQLRGEHEPPVHARPVERLLPHAVPGKRQRLAPRVPHGKPEHPVELLDRCLAQLLPHVGDDLGIRGGPKSVSRGA